MEIYKKINYIKKEIIKDSIKLGTNKCKEKNISVNNSNFIFDGKNVLPVMGEFHFSRFNKKDWKESILKLKACGIDIVATYIFWIYHEEEKNIFDFNGSKDIRAFLKLCKELDIKVLLRLGPWAHGEARNGGFPDWLVQEIPKPIIRSNDDYYLSRVEKFYKALYREVSGYLFKDDKGPVVGIQVENEYKGSREHLMKLKELIISIGFDVPFYTATAWSSKGYSDIPSGEMIPAFGGYPDAPWADHIEKLHRKEQYVFTEIKNDEVIGNDLDQEHVVLGSIDMNLYPYITCELGAGVQATKHRRPKINVKDVVSMAYVKLGSGVNLLGYYMFHGGTNLKGKFSYLNETKDTGYPNDLPKLTYDFQAPIGEYGLINESYFEYKILHKFLNNFGDKIALTKPMIPNTEDKIRYSLRMNDKSGFLFINNYQRFTDLGDIKGVKFKLELDSEIIEFPKNMMNIKSGEYFIMPFNLDLGEINLKYSTTQPILKYENKNKITYFFRAIDGIDIEYLFDNNVEVKNIEVEYKDGILIENIKAGLDSSFTVKKGNKEINIVTLSKSDAMKLWDFKYNDEQYLIFSENVILSDGNSIQIIGDKNVIVYESNLLDSNSNFIKIKNKSQYKEYRVIEKNIEQKELDIEKYNDLNYIININQTDLEQDSVLEIDYIGESAELWLDDKLIADNFFIDGKWKIRLNHILKMKECSIKLKLNEVNDNSMFYVEDEYKFIKKSKTTLKKLVIKPVKKINIY